MKKELLVLAMGMMMVMTGCGRETAAVTTAAETETPEISAIGAKLEPADILKVKEGEDARLRVTYSEDVAVMDIEGKVILKGLTADINTYVEAEGKTAIIELDNIQSESWYGEVIVSGSSAMTADGNLAESMSYVIEVIPAEINEEAPAITLDSEWIVTKTGCDVSLKVSYSDEREVAGVMLDEKKIVLPSGLTAEVSTEEINDNEWAIHLKNIEGEAGTYIVWISGSSAIDMEGNLAGAAAFVIEITD